jgi:hypothetical protein
LREAENPAAYEEGQLLIRGLAYARELGTLPAFNVELENLLVEYAPLM